MILSTAFFAPISWYRSALDADTIVIDRHEHYRKQTWRNRCRIVGPNGTQDLIVPVHLNGNHTPVSEVRIDYSERWQQKHWGAIASAYGQSPFFNHYAELLKPFFEEKRWEKLVELNEESFLLTLRLMKAKMNWSYSEDFVPYSENDLRLLLSPKHRAPHSELHTPNSYIQVFSERHGFIPDLSILDLLFCCGPASLDYLSTTQF